ncbi:MAG TPA: hypothetical protein VNI01_05490 [Elusimicrobiota bacterium]|jgi:hypothetical protein|nr:hypothetical protein [Elusimicrobiota bacterium]
MAPSALALAAAALLLLCVLARRADRFTLDHTRPVRSTLDAAAYRVHPSPDRGDTQAAADLLAAANARTIALLRRLRARYVRGPAGAAFPARRDATLRLLARYNPDNLAENSPQDPSGDTSYSLDKGAVIALCLRDRASFGLHDLETLTFVTLHEMAHVALEELDHPPRFWATFRFLLEEAEAGRIYRSPDYARAPVTYCGVRIDHSPRWDPQIRPI